MKIKFLQLFFIGLFCHGLIFSQEDQLASKKIPYLGKVGSQLIAFGPDSTFSLVDLSSSTPKIFNHTVSIPGIVMGSATGSSSSLFFYRSEYFSRNSEENAQAPDSLYGGLFSIDGNGTVTTDTLLFTLSSEAKTAIGRGIAPSALSINDSLGVLGLGRAGIALFNRAANGLASDSLLSIVTLRQNQDSGQILVQCAFTSACSVDTLGKLSAQPLPEPDSITSLALMPGNADSIWILIGTQRGLRKGLFEKGNLYFPKLRTFPDLDASSGPDSAANILSIFASANQSFCATPSRLYVSVDSANTFRLVKSSYGVNPSQSLIGFTSAPHFYFHNDTAFANLNIEPRGLTLFHGDSLAEASPLDSGLSKVIIDANDGLIFGASGTKVTQSIFLGSSESGSSFYARVLATDGEGIYHTRFYGFNLQGWENLNRLRTVKNKLQEVITFPTVFTGEENVRFGYRLSSNASVTITVYNYAMEKVKTIVKNGAREGAKGRSENPDEDFWDGKDSSGRYVSVGTYYVEVKSSKGDTGWGKVLVIRGRN